MKKDKETTKKNDLETKEFTDINKRIDEIEKYLSSFSVERSIGPLDDKISDLKRNLLSQQLECARLRSSIDQCDLYQKIIIIISIFSLIFSSIILFRFVI